MVKNSVVIVNFNAGADLRDCVLALEQAFGENTWEIIIVDNASTDDSLRLLTKHQSVHIKRNPVNVGFATAVNQGLSAISGQFVLILNPDCQVEVGAVGRLQQELEAHPECALVGPRIVDPDGTIQGSARGDPDILTGLFGRSTLLTRLFPSSALAKRNIRTFGLTGSAGFEVDWVSGACMLTRRDALLSVGGFDNRFFMYWEDADLCRRLRDIGKTVRYVPEAQVMHRVGRSSTTVPEQSIRAFHYSAYLYYATHVARSPLHPVRWFAKFVLGARMLWYLRSAKEIRRTGDKQKSLT